MQGSTSSLELSLNLFDHPLSNLLSIDDREGFGLQGTNSPLGPFVEENFHSSGFATESVDLFSSLFDDREVL